MRNSKFLNCATAALVFAAAAVLLSSCGKSAANRRLYSTTGEVFFNGRPAAGAVLGFHPQGKGAEYDWPQGFPRAIVDDQGAFSVGTFANDDGCPPGDYVVLIVWPAPAASHSADGEETETVDRLQGRYATLETSPLTATVESRPTKLKRFDLN